jgi:hypothetical protein
MSVQNLYKVPLKKWRKWSPLARTVFNRVYDFTFENQWAMLHPKQPKPSPTHWKTTAWNAAWIAADAVDNTIPDEIVEVAA